MARWQRWKKSAGSPWNGWGLPSGGPVEVNMGIALGTVPATDTSVTLTSTVYTDTPQVALAFGGIGVTNTVQADGFQLSHGSTDGVTEQSITSMVINGVSTREADRRQIGDCTLMSNPITEANKLTFNSFGAGSVTLDNSNSDGNETEIMTALYGGAGVLAKEILEVTVNQSDGVEDTYNFVNAEDYNVFIVESAFVGATTSVTNATSFVGICTFKDNAISQYCHLMRAERDGFAGSNPSGANRTDCVAGGFKTNPQGGFDYTLQITGVSNGTISLTPDFGSISGHKFKITAMKIDTRLHFAVCPFELPRDKGLWTFDYLGFEPTSMLCVLSHLKQWYSTSSGATDITAGLRAVTMWNALGEQATMTWANNEDATTLSECFNVWYDRPFSYPYPTGSITATGNNNNGFLVADGDTIAGTSNGWTLDLDGANGSSGNRTCFGLFIGGRNDDIDLTTGLARLYKFDEKLLATSATDGSVNNATGTVNGCTTFQDAKVVKGFHFDGVAASVSETSTTGLSSVDTFTYCCWIRTNSTRAIAPLYQRGGQAILQIKNGTQIELYDDNDASSYVSNVDASISNNTIHHIAVVKNGNGANGITFYLDGVAIGTETSSTVTGTGTALKVGRDSSSNFYLGWVDDLRDYERALTLEELNALPGF